MSYHIMLLWVTNCLLLRHVAIRSRSEQTCLFYTRILIFSRENYEHGMQLFMFYVRDLRLVDISKIIVRNSYPNLKPLVVNYQSF